ncbi:MAG: Hsp33 family molecular chaperone HslO [Tissierellia bacterium]|nr:Hsp33 family molecular chaperone HslO [Tissierellia bacterium]
MGYLIRAIDSRERIKLTVAITTDVVNEAAKTHKLSKTASAALGRTLTATAIMGSWLKNPQDAITVNIKGNGPLGRMITTCKNDGYIKGYVDHPDADLPTRKSDGKLDVGSLVGQGIMTVVMDLGLKEPYTGQVPLVSGEIGEDFAHYFFTSEQIPSAVGLGVLVDVDYSIRAAGGFILQLMPDATEEIIAQVEKNLEAFSSVTEYIDKGYSAEDIAKKLLSGFDIKILETGDISYQCDCSRKKVEEALSSIHPDEIIAMIEEDGQAEVNCYFCHKNYYFNQEELEKMLEMAKSE